MHKIVVAYPKQKISFNTITFHFLLIYEWTTGLVFILTSSHVIRIAVLVNIENMQS